MTQAFKYTFRMSNTPKTSEKAICSLFSGWKAIYNPHSTLYYYKNCDKGIITSNKPNMVFENNGINNILAGVDNEPIPVAAKSLGAIRK